MQPSDRPPFPGASPGGPADAARRQLRLWIDAVAAAVAPLAVMTAVAALGLWAAGAAALPEGAFPAVLAATVLLAVGVPLDLTGNAAFVAQAQGGITGLPLSVTLAGALVAGAAFLQPLRHRALVGPGELTGRALRTAVLWLALLLLVRHYAQHTFTVPTGDSLLDQLGSIFGGAPTVGFRAAPLPTLGVGLAWLCGVLLLAFLVARRAPLPARLLRVHATVRPAGHAVLSLLTSYVLVGLVTGLVSAATDGHPRDTFAVLLLALPNLAWIALGVGIGGSWHGHSAGTVGLPIPEPLASVLQASRSRDVNLDLSSLAQQDGRSWLLLALAVVLVLLTGFGAALHSPGRLPLWRHALSLALALALAMLVIGLLTTVSAEFGLSLLGLHSGAGSLHLSPDLLRTVALGALWGAVAGLLGALPARSAPERIRRG
ncbi:streptophobe family protein [Kitasatospora sp. HPMI-4]|uniref:streptophobe family protein n=1 Tax=Kitasatospora sp. HPMI-4 TaxID=3448443 RepID=UPI003F1D976E